MVPVYRLEIASLSSIGKIWPAGISIDQSPIPNHQSSSPQTVQQVNGTNRLRLYPLSVIASSFTLTMALLAHTSQANEAPSKPHIILVMADDQGWGQTGYYNHPVLKTPHLDAMASGGLRFDRFYAGAPVCSPTRASVLTGRANDRTGVESHGYALRRQEITLATILKNSGYATGHFGKWHLNGIRGPGVPILKEDSHGPRHFGFDTWVSVTNFFDMDPILSRQGSFEEFTGDSSEIAVREAVRFIDRFYQQQPTFSVIWFGSPHDPAKASVKDREAFSHLDEKSQHHYGELVAMDRSIGQLFSELEKRNLKEETLVWFCSDNGGLPKIEPGTVGNLRGNKGSVFEGGLRVPGILHWPIAIRSARVSQYPAGVIDILPTVLDLLNLDHPNMNHVLDGISLKPLLNEEIATRNKPIPFRHLQRAAWVDNDYKILSQDIKKKVFALYNLKNDPSETENLAQAEPERLSKMVAQFERWNKTVERSVAGLDYESGRVLPGDPVPRFWTEMESYQPWFDAWSKRWEYESRLTPKGGRPKASKN